LTSPASFFSSHLANTARYSCGGVPKRPMADFASAPSGLLLPGNHKERNDVRLSLRASFVAVLFAAISAAEASAQTPEQFYAGKTIDFVIGYPPGGS
jgi:hypothetical protein